MGIEVLGNFVRNIKNAPSIQEGLLAARPATARLGAIYITTDSGNNQAFRWDGAAWQLFGSGAASGLLTADNGLTPTGTNVELGGDLIKNTSITNLIDNFFAIVLSFTSGNLNAQFNNEILLEWTDSAGNGSAMVLSNQISILSYSDNLGNVQDISFRGAISIIEDLINSQGLVNAGDYEAQFVARSLITKQFADAAYAPAGGGGLTGANNGLSVSGANAQLGGTLTAPTIIETGSNSLRIENTSLDRFVFTPTSRQFLLQINNTTTGPRFGFLITAASIQFFAEDNPTTHLQAFLFTGLVGGIMQTVDTLNSQGLVYGGDYEAQFVARSLVTKQYVASVAPGVVARQKLTGIIASQTVLTFANPAVDTMYRGNFVAIASAIGVGAATGVISYTDNQGNAATVSFTTVNALGSIPFQPINIFVKASTTITMSVTITGVITVNLDAVLESLG